jgi:outer membrane lipoprotein-sorting protein
MRILLALAAIVAFPLVAAADVQSDMQQVAAAYNAQKSYHADEHFSNGQTVSVDYIPPDRIRVTQPDKNTGQVIIGNDFWVNSNGKWSKMPSFAAKMVTGKVDQYRHLMPQDITDVKDLGMQNVNGKSLHAYQFNSSGVPVTMWVDANHLPAQMQTTSRGITTTVIYSYGNVTIDPPQ